MDREKQIEEIANDLNQHCCCLAEQFCGESNCNYCITRFLYYAGYRKQTEGEWTPSDIPEEKYTCSVCGGACWYYDYGGEVAKSRYCPNCGAKMKVGDLNE